LTNPYRDVSSRIYIAVCMECNGLSIFGSAENGCCTKIENLKPYRVFNDETEAKNFLRGITG
jgi:hypothetical protein